MPERRRLFAPVVLAGVASAGLAAVAGTRAWLEPVLPTGSVAASAVLAQTPVTTLQESPLAGALALVVLACWGVLLVTRGRFRRVVSWLAVAAAAGLVVTTLAAPWTMPDALGEQLRTQLGTDAVASELTPWWWVAAVASVVAVTAASAAAWAVPDWPEMGARYDAPTGRPDPGTATAGDGRPEPESTDNLDLWKAMDEGRDPTA